MQPQSGHSASVRVDATVIVTHYSAVAKLSSRSEGFGKSKSASMASIGLPGMKGPASLPIYIPKVTPLAITESAGEPILEYQKHLVSCRKRV